MFRHYDDGELTIAMISVVLNSAVVGIIVKEKHLHTPTNIIVAHMSIADLMLGLLGVPSTIIMKAHTKIDFHACLFFNSVMLLLDTMPIIMIVCVSAIRFVAVRFPRYYKTSLYTRRVMKIAGFSWGFGILHGLIPIVYNNGSANYKSKCMFLAVIPESYLLYHDIFFKFLFPMIVMCVLYAYIGHILKKQNRKHSTVGNVTSAKLFTTIILVHLVCMMPIVLMDILEIFDVHQPTMQYIAILLTRAHSVVNPFIYAFSNKNIISALRGVVFKKKYVPDTESEDSSFEDKKSTLFLTQTLTPVMSVEEIVENKVEKTETIEKTESVVSVVSGSRRSSVESSLFCGNENMQDNIIETPEIISIPPVKEELQYTTRQGGTSL